MKRLQSIDHNHFTLAPGQCSLKLPMIEWFELIDLNFNVLELGRGRGISNLDKKSPNYKACALNLN